MSAQCRNVAASLASSDRKADDAHAHAHAGLLQLLDLRRRIAAAGLFAVREQHDETLAFDGGEIAATFASDAPMGVFAPFFASSFAIFAPTVAAFSGLSGISRSVWHESTSRPNTRMANGVPAGIDG